MVKIVPWQWLRASPLLIMALGGCNSAALFSEGSDLRQIVASDGGASDIGPAVDLAGADLSGVDFASAPVDLAGADFAGVDLIGGPDLLDVDALPSGVTQGPCHGCAWHNGVVSCWGSNGFGELGDNSRTSRASAAPVEVLTGVIQVSVGCSNPVAAAHSCAVTAGGDLYCWGGNNYGQIGDQTATDQLVPVKVPGLPSVAAVSLGSRHSSVLTRDGHVYTWGDSSAAQLGFATAVTETAPKLVPALANVVEISAGYFHECVRLSSGGLDCWGRNAYGEVGSGDTIAVFNHEPVLTNVTDVVQIAAGAFHTCMRRAIGSAWCWGSGMYGQMGNGKTPPEQLTPVQVDLPFSPVELSSTSALCARDPSGNVSCWGARVDQNGTAVYPSTPEPMTPLSGVLSLGGACAMLPAAAVSCWGFNFYGQVGNDSMVDQPSPVAVKGLSW